MKSMEDQGDRLNRLRERRAHAQALRDQERLRETYGERLVAAVAAATGRVLSLDDFDRGVEEPLPFCWPKDIVDAIGLVAPYISRFEANELLSCVRGRLGTLSGSLGFHEKPYLGIARLDGTDPGSLLLVAESTEDSVVFYSDDPTGVIMVDCYPSQSGGPFSIVVQGERLVRELTDCLPANSHKIASR